LLAWGWAERVDQFAGPFEALGYLQRDPYRGIVLRVVDIRATVSPSLPLDAP
jgi:hypothetical protein